MTLDDIAARAPFDDAKKPIPGLMQNWPLTIDKIITHAAAAYPHAKIVSRGNDLALRTTTYAEIEQQSRRISSAFAAHGVGAGDIVATIAWNSDRHIELWYGAGGIGAVIHPLNPRLTPEQIIWIIHHAGDCAIFLDPAFLPLVEAIAGSLSSVRLFVLLTSEVEMPANTFGAISLEAFLANGTRPERWGDFPEDGACSLFYTSGTTSNPKGVLYSHRSNSLHAMLAAMAYGLTTGDIMMPVVPMFHANCWGLVHIAPMIGASLVLPGPALDPASLHALIESEGVTHAAGVPTMWSALHQHLMQTGKRVPTLRRLFTAGSAVPRSLIRRLRDDLDVEIVTAWGMTETSPSGTIGGYLPRHLADDEDALSAAARQGRMLYGVEMTIRDEDGQTLPHDGRSSGRLMVRGPAVLSAYFRSDVKICDEDGYFDTGDIGVIHPDSIMQITDRAKDIVKSGGEWISSLTIEDAVALHPAIEHCAVIGIPSERWDERPLLIVRLRSGTDMSADQIRDFLVDKLPKWWLPEIVEFIEEMPLGATGKVDKKRLRLIYAPLFGMVGAAA
ncbi:long-chain fatty acid--CoA ligase [Sphingobium sp. CR2-8]|uniref:long-chain fatty acid--CoA ligase n=1 Tax=Sphingobium sp. CR2-8 TaxID=1306534 RepID=UPI002DB59B0B|nr:long-chain fatty acid--CoA ligase [Sphingobium sp. CR2-8]MEC3909228.1 long-chain fatty acid--CoA ligase [Sphingobium sp. CR2-8]